MLFKKKKTKIYGIPKNAFVAPYKYRFTFVAEGTTYFEGYAIRISESIHKDRAFYIACAIFQRDNELKPGKKFAVFYGDNDTPECQDTLVGAYTSAE